MTIELPRYNDGSSCRWQGNYRAFVGLVKNLVLSDWHAVADPTGDPQPLIFMHRKGSLHIQRVPGAWYQSRVAKEALVREVFVPLAGAGAKKFATANAAWTSRPGSPLFHEVTRLIETNEPIPAFDSMGLDGLVEEVLLSVFDAERHEGWMATVTRSDDKGPAVGEWRLEGPDSLSGHWVDPIREIMRGGRPTSAR